MILLHLVELQCSVS